MNRLSRLAVSLGIATAMAVPSLAHAEARWSVGSGGGLSAHADLNLRVIVPEIIMLRVGNFGGGVANINTVTWDATGTSVSDAVTSGPIPPNTTTLPFVRSDDNGASDGTVSVQVFGNDGSVTLSSADTNVGYLVSGSDSIPLTDFSVATTGTISHPPFNGTTVTVPATGRIVNASDTWTYTYTPSSTPPAGDYNTTVTYTASNP